jgi:arylsulfatase A-like enzyme
MPTAFTRRDFLKMAAMLPMATLGLRPTVEKFISSATVAAQADPAQPNIIIVVLDALSATNMSLYGYPRDTTPNINQFAAKSTVFHKHYSGGSFTTPGTATLLSGALPWAHHAVNIQGMVNSTFTPRNIFNLAPAGTHTSALTHNLLVATLLYQFREYLSDLGMARDLSLVDLEYSDLLFKEDYNVSFAGEDAILRGTSMVTSSLFFGFLFHNLNESRRKELNKKYRKQFPRGVPNPAYLLFLLEKSMDQIIEQVQSQPKPFLSYYHLFAPHTPYKPRRDFIDLFKDDFTPIEKPTSFATLDLDQAKLNENRLYYDRYLAYADEEFGRLVNTLEQNGVLENTWVILTADHGELFERGIWGHITPTLYDPILHIPLVISQPGVNTRKDIYDYTSSIDLLPTLLDGYGLPIPEWCEGQVLPLKSNSVLPSRPIYAMDSKESSRHGPITQGTFMVIQDDYKLIHYIDVPDATGDELYNLAQDPEEMVNLAQTESAIAADLRQQILNKLAEANQA